MTKPRPWRDVGLAFTLLTAVPLPVKWERDGGAVDAASYFPLVGLLLGSLLAAAAWLASRFFYGLSPVAAALLLVLLAVVTRMLHFDGLADVADGWHVARDRRLEVMADSQIGAFGATAVALVVLLQWSALVSLGSAVGTAPLVVLAPVFGRLAATFSAWLGKPAKPLGLGASVMGRPSSLGAIVAFLTLVAGCLVPLGLGSSPLVVGVLGLAAFVAALVVPHLIAERFGGVTGDTMGASVMVVETIVLVGATVLVSAFRLVGWSA